MPGGQGAADWADGVPYVLDTVHQQDAVERRRAGREAGGSSKWLEALAATCRGKCEKPRSRTNERLVDCPL